AIARQVRRRTVQVVVFRPSATSAKIQMIASASWAAAGAVIASAPGRRRDVAWAVLLPVRNFSQEPVSGADSVDTIGGDRVRPYAGNREFPAAPIATS
ncbi:MAG TPA: hypothetical protein VGL20_18290, partial [Candidatus Dormibacteraeota bacterium]